MVSAGGRCRKYLATVLHASLAARAAFGFGNIAKGRRRPGSLRAALLRGYGCPAGNRAANRAPPTEALVNLRRHRSLLLECQAVGFDLRVGDVPDCAPSRRIGAKLGGDQPKHSITHFRNIAEPLKLVVVI